MSMGGLMVRELADEAPCSCTRHFSTSCVVLQVEAQSYKEIELSLGVDEPSQIMFATDVYGEAVAASEAGWEAVLVVRPGNKPLPSDAAARFRIVESMEELLE